MTRYIWRKRDTLSKLVATSAAGTRLKLSPCSNSKQSITLDLRRRLCRDNVKFPLHSSFQLNERVSRWVETGFILLVISMRSAEAMSNNTSNYGSLHISRRPKLGKWLANP